jgi:hypothetical protein
MKLDKYKERVFQFVDSLLEAAAQLQPSVPSSDKVNSIKKNFYIEYAPTQMELECLKMKAIVLVKNAPNLNLNIKEILQLPIEAGAIPLKEGRLEIHLLQRFEVFGSKYRLEGRFVKPAPNSFTSIPLANTFRIVPES